MLRQIKGCDNEQITPILVDPDENEYFCSDIATSPDDTSFLSTWYGTSSKIGDRLLIASSPILQTEMFSGSWYIVIEGLTFAYVRTFTLTVGAPTTVTVSSIMRLKWTPANVHRRRQQVHPRTPNILLQPHLTDLPQVTVGITSTPDAISKDSAPPLGESKY